MDNKVTGPNWKETTWRAGTRNQNRLKELCNRNWSNLIMDSEDQFAICRFKYVVCNDFSFEGDRIAISINSIVSPKKRNS